MASITNPKRHGNYIYDLKKFLWCNKLVCSISKKWVTEHKNASFEHKLKQEETKVNEGSKNKQSD